MANERVKIFTTPDCNLCKQAARFLADKGVGFEIIDITRDDEGFQEMQTLSRGAKQVPVIKIGNSVLVGFDRIELEKALSRV